MSRKNDPNAVVQRRQAMIGKVHCVQVPPGTQVFDLYSEKPLGIVMDGFPVINGNTCYLSTDDFLAAEKALPKPDTLRN